MKGSRINQQSALPSEVSGEPILRPFTGTSKYSNARGVSPTFDMNASSPQSPMKDDVMNAMNGELTVSLLN